MNPYEWAGKFTLGVLMGTSIGIAIGLLLVKAYQGGAFDCG